MSEHSEHFIPSAGGPVWTPDPRCPTCMGHEMPHAVRDRAENVIRDQLVAHGLGLLSATAAAAMAVDDLLAAGLLGEES